MPDPAPMNSDLIVMGCSPDLGRFQISPKFSWEPLRITTVHKGWSLSLVIQKHPPLCLMYKTPGPRTNMAQDKWLDRECNRQSRVKQEVYCSMLKEYSKRVMVPLKEKQKQGKSAECRAKFRKNHVGSDLPVGPDLVQRFRAVAQARHCLIAPALLSGFHSNTIISEGLLLKLIYYCLSQVPSSQPSPPLPHYDASFFIFSWKWSYFYTYLVLKCNLLNIITWFKHENN